MTDPQAAFTPLKTRELLEVSGSDRVHYLQGLVSNDVTRVAPDQAVHAAFLTPQGKYLFDFIMLELGDRLLLDCGADQIDDLERRLRMYRLRSRVDLARTGSRWQVHVAWGDMVLDQLGLPAIPGAAVSCGEGLALTDPRIAQLGARLVLPDGVDPASFGLVERPIDEYEDLRISLGVPDGNRDMVADKTILLEAGFDELNGVDWEKGCYMGQELTARTRYRGLIKRRLLPVEVHGPLPHPGTPVMLDGREAGEIRSGRGNRAIALLRIAMLKDHATPELYAGDARIVPCKPDWARF